MDKIEIAKSIAMKVHGDQVDKKDFPYLAHIYDVAERVKKYGESYYIVGFLHDAIEDACDISEEFQQDVIMEIKENFDKEIYDAIIAMTKLKPPLRETKEDLLTEYLPRLKQNPIALKVKIADSSHNLSKAYLIEDVILQDKLRQKYVKTLDFLGVDGSKQEKQITFKNNKWTER